MISTGGILFLPFLVKRGNNLIGDLEMTIAKFDYEIYTLSDIFYDVYNAEEYPEILNKEDRPYSCLLIETIWDFFICIPYRTDIRHRQAYKFKNTSRSKYHESGLDYSKMVIIKEPEYIGEKTIIDQDEFNETRDNIDIIVNDAMEYLEEYIKHHKGDAVLATAMYERKYKYSSLQYFHEELNI